MSIEEQINDMILLASVMKASPGLSTDIKVAALEAEVALRKLGLEILKTKIAEPV